MSHFLSSARKLLTGASRGVTLIELMVAMSISTVIMLAAFGLITAAQSETTRTDQQVSMDQSARIALEHVMEELHSGCIVPARDPVQSRLTEPTLPGSSESLLSFVTITGSSIRVPEVRLVQIKYEPKSTAEPTNYVLREFVRLPTSETDNETHYAGWKFQTTPTPVAGRILVEHVVPTKTEREGATKIPMFRYYRYYPSTPENPGEIEPNPMEPGLTESSGPNALTAEQAASVAKVTVTFSVETPQGKARHMIPTPLEDSAVYRLTPASTEAGKPNEPCT